MPRPADVTTEGRALVVFVCALTAFVLVMSRGWSHSSNARAEPPPPAPSAPVYDAAPPPLPPLLPPPSTDHVTIADDRGRSIEVYPPLAAKGRAPLVVFLHATCMDPRPVCDLIGRAGREETFLVCPSGNDTCYGAPDWHGTGDAKSAFLSSALEKTQHRFGNSIAHDDTLIGWSRGAFAARDILSADVARGAAPRFTSLLLIAADVSPEPALLRKAGIRRVLFTAGDQDGSRFTMKSAAAKLAMAGIPARYVSLGPIGHWLPEDLEERLRPSIAWVRDTVPP